VNKHASERFEVHVHFPVRDAQEFPVLEVDAGTEALVAARRPLQNANGDTLVKQHAVYIRSLSQNNTPSTGEPRWDNWSSILDPLFDNSEADIGRFLRRHSIWSVVRGCDASGARALGRWWFTSTLS
jgi:hypothetical protein